MANSGRSGAPSWSMEAICGTLMLYCSPSGVLTGVLWKPFKVKATVDSCSVQDKSLTVGDSGCWLCMGIHSWAMMPRGRKNKAMSNAIEFRMVVVFDAAKIIQKRKTRIDGVCFSPSCGRYDTKNQIVSYDNAIFEVLSSC